MPNHITTVIEFTGKQENIEKIFELIAGENGEIDFNKLIPTPDNIYQGNIGQKEREIYGENNWFDWNVKHWGTKWNAYGICVDDNTLSFDTAWSFPEPVMDALAKLCYEHEVDFTGEWADEDTAYNTGYFESNCQNDEYYFSYDYYEDESDEAFEAYIRCKGENDCIGKNKNGNWVHYDCDSCPNKDNC